MGLDPFAVEGAGVLGFDAEGIENPRNAALGMYGHFRRSPGEVRLTRRGYRTPASLPARIGPLQCLAMAGFAPPLLLALFGAWCGTFWGVSSLAGAAAAASLLGGVFWIGAPWRDPLRLGRAGRLLPPALWIAVAASAFASPVSRAGWVSVLLLPTFLALPGLVERC